MASRLQDVLLRGVAASRPAATAVANGTLYWATDVELLTQSDGVVWSAYSASAGASTSTRVLLASQTASASASLNFTTRTAGGALFQADYDHYRIELIQVCPTTDNVHLIFRTSSDGGATWMTASGAYFYHGVSAINTTVAGFNDATFASTYGLLASGVDNGSAAGLRGVYGHLELWRPTSTPEMHRWASDATGYNNTPVLDMRRVNGWVTSTAALTAIQVLAVSGTLASGTVRVYGLT